MGIIIAKVYEPKEVEKRWSEWWLKEGLFVADPHSTKPHFSMVIPPPNITGSLHLGHALNNTLQDIMARWKRMKGCDVLWLPGIDHAGIATQNVVERQLKEEGTSREALGREEFQKRVWKWKEESASTIVTQLKRLGASCDWTRLRFTMDEGLSRAVREVFSILYGEGLVFRGDYIINFCPRCSTALSDLEVKHVDKESFLYHIEYPVKEGGSLTVATTRPETILGDTAVAINPQDERYRGFSGKTVLLPLTGREIPVVEDPAVDMEFGTGAVKITPAHDFNDFETATRHGLASLKVMDLDARMNENAGAYRGLKREEARERIVEDLKKAGLLKKEEKYRLPLGVCYRCGTAVEPTLSRQWFVKVKPLAGPAIEAVKRGEVGFVPKLWEKTYFEWMENIHNWCISRQIWWGHRIPAWYCKECGHTTVSTADPVGCEGCGSTKIEQDPDVLDTWFSSALWPFSTMGWPEKTAEGDVFYPTTALFTSFDIIFFWVARMIMMGLKFKESVPFKTVYIHALVRDAAGQKMSKSKGNVIDPLPMMERYGTDALRFTLASFASQGRDIKLAEERIEGYRNFTNKLWNLARFALMNMEMDMEGWSIPQVNPEKYTRADKWIITRLSVCIEEVDSSLENYEFDAAARAVYSFIWHELCDWYVEIIKPDLKGDKGKERKAASRNLLLSILADTLKILHPFMPFITEEIHSYLPGAAPGIMKTSFPHAPGKYPEEAQEMEVVMEVIRAIRNIRTEMNISPAIELDCVCSARDASGRNSLAGEEANIKLLARLRELRVSEGGERPEKSAFAEVMGIEVYVPLSGHVDIKKETSRLEKEIAKLIADISGVKEKLENRDFIANAPGEIVEKEKERLSLLMEKKVKLEAGVERIRGLEG